MKRYRDPRSVQERWEAASSSRAEVGAMMKVAIVGSRDGVDFKKAEQEIAHLLSRPEITYVISGGARGIDSIGAELARQFHKALIVHRADWVTHHRRAGFVRNALIVRDADEVHAWWDGNSRGTQHTIELAKRQGKPTFVHVVPSETPR